MPQNLLFVLTDGGHARLASPRHFRRHRMTDGADERRWTADVALALSKPSSDLVISRSDLGPLRRLRLGRRLCSVANLTRDVAAYPPLASVAKVRPRVRRYPLEAAGPVLDDLRSGAFSGCAVLEIDKG